MKLTQLKGKFAIRVPGTATEKSYSTDPLFVIDANEDQVEACDSSRPNSFFISGHFLNDEWKEIKPLPAFVEQMKKKHRLTPK